ncbi:MAG TPA: hypothetical protein PK926_16460 [Spirochaetota bacterium]|nr:hypothetical protein [Spirochaetota bacterium]HPI90562.1 hypothetical protein [Spirochaetota bacterium]HPR49254.1 hypothetical protein [Spirochaetota bacterium]
MEKIFTSLDEFMAEARKAGIEKLVFAEVNEKRAIQKDSNMVEVVRYVVVEVIGYKKPVIYKYSIDGDGLDAEGPDGLYDRIVAGGFDVTRKSRNIT